MVGPLQDPITLVELGCGSGEKLALLAEALRGRRKRVLVHLIDISPDALELSERTLGGLEHVSVVGHRATYEVGLRARRVAAANGGNDARALPGLEHRQLRHSRPPTSSCAEIRRLPPARRRAAPRRRPREARARAAARLRRPARRDRRLQQEPARPHEHRAARRLRPLGLRARAVLESDRARASRCTSSRCARRPSASPRAECVVAFSRGERIWTESSYKYDPDEIVRMGRRPASASTSSGSSPTRGSRSYYSSPTESRRWAGGVGRTSARTGRGRGWRARAGAGAGVDSVAPPAAWAGCSPAPPRPGPRAGERWDPERRRSGAHFTSGVDALQHAEVRSGVEHRSRARIERKRADVEVGVLHHPRASAVERLVDADRRGGVERLRARRIDRERQDVPALRLLCRPFHVTPESSLRKRPSCVVA